MKIVQLSSSDDSVVIHFHTEGATINAYTLASTLVAFADAAKAANESINPGYDVEVVVEAIAPGSFRTKIRAFYRKHRNLFSKEIALALAVNVAASYIYERSLAADNKISVTIQTDEVIIERGGEKLVVPRNVYDASRNAEKDEKFVTAISRTFQALERDADIKGIGFVDDLKSPPPEILVTREAIVQLAALPAPEPDSRVVSEIVDLQILKAILDRGNRKWEFMWRGIRISAPISHEAFYEQFFAHRITIAPGDVLRARLAIAQERDPQTGIYSNRAYDVVEVFEHVPRLRQTNLPGHECCEYPPETLKKEKERKAHVERMGLRYDANTWKAEPLFINDGGMSYFRALFDPANREFIWYEENFSR